MWVCRTLFTSPLALVGLWEERQTVKLQLFNGYTDQVDLPFVFFKALLRARAGAGAVPRVYKAVVHVSLRLGLVGRLLFLVRLPPKCAFTRCLYLLRLLFLPYALCIATCHWA